MGPNEIVKLLRIEITKEAELLTQGCLSGDSGDPARQIAHWQEVMHQLMQEFTGKVEIVFEHEGEVVGPACRKGCAHCCTMTVAVNPLDMWPIALKRGAELAAIAGQLTERADLISQHTAPERQRLAIYCGLLDPETKACRVYEDRPLPCRGLLSYEEPWCAEYQRKGQMPSERNPPIDWIRVVLHGSAQAGAFAAAKAMGLDMTWGELNIMLAAVVPDIEGSFKRWVAGERIFVGLEERNRLPLEAAKKKGRRAPSLVIV